MTEYNLKQVKKTRVQSLVVSISDDVVYIPRAITQEYSFDKHKFVNVYFDKDKEVLGIELLDKPGPHSFKLTKVNKNTCSFSSKGLVQNFGVPKGKYKTEEFKENFLILKNEKR
jgi:hypothetical protein